MFIPVMIGRHALFKFRIGVVAAAARTSVASTAYVSDVLCSVCNFYRGRIMRVYHGATLGRDRSYTARLYTQYVHSTSLDCCGGPLKPCPGLGGAHRQLRITRDGHGTSEKPRLKFGMIA